MPLRLKRLAGFLGGMLTLAISPPPEGKAVLSGSDREVCFTASLGSYTLQPAIPSAGGGVTTASPRHCAGPATEY